MAKGDNARKNGHHREYWSRRPFSGIGWGKVLKRMTHKAERRIERKASILEQLAEGQEPLGAEFEKVWDDNIDTLYES